MQLSRSLMPMVLVMLVACGDDGTTDPPTNPPAQTLASISLPTTTFTVTAGESTTLAPVALDAAGAPIAGVTGFTFTSSEPTVAEAGSDGSVLAVGAGSAVVTVSLTRDGVTATTMADFAVTGTLPTEAEVVAGNSSQTFTPASIVVAVDAEVTFTFGALVHNVTHGTTPGAPANVPNSSNVSVVSTFTTAGDFLYDCTIHAGMQGEVIVR